MIELPAATAAPMPVAPIVAAAGVADDHAAAGSGALVASEKWPVAVKATVVPGATLGTGGVTVMVWSVAFVTVTVVWPEIAPTVAVRIEVPAETPVTSPAGSMVATAGVADPQLTTPVRSSDVPSEKLPTARRARENVRATLGMAGSTTMVTSTGPVTVSVVLPLMAPLEAVIVAVPARTPDATPVWAMVAVAVGAEDQVTLEVTFAVLPSE